MVVDLTTIDNNTQIKVESWSEKLDLVLQLPVLIDINIPEINIGSLVVVEQEAVLLVESGIVESKSVLHPYSIKSLIHDGSIRVICN